MKRSLQQVILVFFCFWIIHPLTFVKAEYVLPYPSAMPGNKIYRVSRMFDQLKRYWSFGSIAQSKYVMSMADKYLVEAKILFEYKQYLLAFDALERSDQEIATLPEYIRVGVSQRKNMSLVVSSVNEEIKVHVTLLEKLQKELPSEFTWTPEKQASTVLSIHKKLEDSIGRRTQMLATLGK